MNKVIILIILVILIIGVIAWGIYSVTVNKNKTKDKGEIDDLIDDHLDDALQDLDYIAEFDNLANSG